MPSVGYGDARCGADRTRAECLLCGATAGSSRPSSRSDGILHLQQRCHRCTPRAEKARCGARRHHRLGCSPWQWNSVIFYTDGSVLYFSTHQWPWYPGTGHASETGVGKGPGWTINCPLPAGSGRQEILGAFRDRLFPALEVFRPELLLISAGFDSRIDDPLGQFRLTDEDFADLTRMLLDFAAGPCAGRVVSVLEGGYNLSGLGSAAKAHMTQLLE